MEFCRYCKVLVEIIEYCRYLFGGSKQVRLLILSDGDLRNF